MSWDLVPTFDAAHRAALEHGQPFVYVCPPAGWALAPLWAATPGIDGQTVVLVPTADDAVDIATAAAGPGGVALHPVTGLARTEALLTAGAVADLVATPSEVQQLLGRGILKTDRVRRLVAAWPDRVESPDRLAGMDEILTGLPDAHRIVAVSELTPSESFLERHARRAPTLAAASLPPDPKTDLRMAVVAPHARPEMARAVLDAVVPSRAVWWGPTLDRRWPDMASLPDLSWIGDLEGRADLALVLDLPTPGVLAQLADMADEVVVFVRPTQVSYLERMVDRLRPYPLPGAPDRMREEASRWRQIVQDRLGQADLATGLMAVEPLLDRWDPALVAAAAVSLAQPAPGGGPVPAPPLQWTRVFVSAGQRDGVRPPDILGVLTRGAELDRADVGRIDVRESFTLVEVRPEMAPRAIRGVAGQTLRGRRVTARLDRAKGGGRGRSS